MTVPLSHELVALTDDAAQHALQHGRLIAVDDLLAALLRSPKLGPRLESAIAQAGAWQPEKSPAAQGDTGVYRGDRQVMFDKQAERLFFDGSKAVLLGPYEPRHLAEAIGAAAELHPEKFKRFGFDAKAWRRALRVKTSDH